MNDSYLDDEKAIGAEIDSICSHSTQLRRTIECMKYKREL